MPAEWETHESTWLVWPKNQATWPGRLLKEVESVYIEMMAALLSCEKVKLLVPDKPAAETVLKKLAVKKADTSKLIFYKVNTVDTWIRDYGPIFVKSVIARSEATKSFGKLRMVSEVESQSLRRDCFASLAMTSESKAFTKWEFNAWGGKYKDLARDNGVVDRIPELKKYRRWDTGMVLEGGSIEVNGRGTCLTTEQCLLSPRRNPKLSRRDIEHRLGKYLGIKKVIWLSEGIEGDDTDGHVDDIARFVNPNTVIAAAEENPSDPNQLILKRNLEILRSERDAGGRRLRVIELPMPGRVFIPASLRGATATKSFGKLRMVSEVESQSLRRDCFADARNDTRLPASYANFYIANGLVLVPVYSRSNDRQAIKIIRKAFPDRRVLPIECTALVFGLGSIHCITQQEPR